MRNDVFDYDGFIKDFLGWSTEPYYKPWEIFAPMLRWCLDKDIDLDNPEHIVLFKLTWWPTICVVA